MGKHSGHSIAGTAGASESALIVSLVESKPEGNVIVNRDFIQKIFRCMKKKTNIRGTN